jgi:hypothetical protein
MSYINLDDGSDSVTSVGAQLLAKADAFKAQAQAILGEIQDKEAGSPWGADQTGQNFHTQYTKDIDTGNGSAPFNAALQDKLSNAGDDLSKIGNGTITAMVTFNSTDAVSADDISKL